MQQVGPFDARADCVKNKNLASPSFSAFRRPALLCSQPKINVFRLEMRPSSTPSPPFGRGGHGSGMPELTPAGFCVFCSNLESDPESKFCEKPDLDPESLFNFGSRVYVVISLVKTWVVFGWINDGSRSLSRSQILNFEKLPVSSKISDFTPCTHKVVLYISNTLRKLMIGA